MDPNVDALLWNGRAQESYGSESVYGVVPALVVGIDDKKEKRHRMGAVQVKFPWLTDDGAELDLLPWARCVTFASGKDGDGEACGWVSTPQVGDEVLVGFENGDPRRPYVLGGLFNPTGGDGEDGGGGVGAGGGGGAGGAGGAGAGQAGAGQAKKKGGAAAKQSDDAADDKDKDKKKADPVKKDLRLRLNVNPQDASSRDDKFTLTATDGSFEKTLTVKDDLVPGDRFVDLLFPQLEVEKSYTLKIDPGKEGAPYFIFQGVPLGRLVRKLRR